MKARTPSETPMVHGAPGLRTLRPLWLLALALVLPAAPAPGAQRQTMTRHVPAAVATAAPANAAPRPQEMDLAFALALPNPANLDLFLQDLYNPASPNYRRYLTTEQFTARFAPTQKDYDAVIQFAQANGLTIVTTHPNRLALIVHGATADIEKALHVRVGVYQHPTEPRTFYAPDQEPAVDLDVPLSGIWGLEDFHVATPGGGPAPTGLPPSALPGGGTGSASDGSFLGNDLRAAYVPGTSLNGSGQIIGLFELDGYYASDVVAYENASGISPHVPLVNVLVDGFPGTPGTSANSVGEVSLDIEVSLAMAPGVNQVRVYEATNNGAHIMSLLNKIANENLAKQVSSSWFIYNPGGADGVYAQMAAQGQSFFQCSGDLLAFYSGIGQWADSPYITICGGTMLTTTGPGGTWVSEKVWNNGNGTNGTGGGISLNYTIPLWQQGISMASNQGSTSSRNVPDVAMLAYQADVYYFNGSVGWFWGTSIAAPMWAGFMALVNQQSVGDGYGTIGFANPAIYSIARGTAYTNSFHDTTVGNNHSSVSTTRYAAATGYDLCTGWGTPTGTSLIDALAGFANGTWVSFANVNPGNGTYTNPYNTMVRGVSGVQPGANLLIKAPSSSAETMTITKPMTIRAVGGNTTIGH